MTIRYDHKIKFPTKKLTGKCTLFDTVLNYFINLMWIIWISKNDQKYWFFLTTRFKTQLKKHLISSNIE